MSRMTQVFDVSIGVIRAVKISINTCGVFEVTKRGTPKERTR